MPTYRHSIYAQKQARGEEGAGRRRYLAVDDDPAVLGGVVEGGLLHAVQLRQRRHLVGLSLLPIYTGGDLII